MWFLRCKASAGLHAVRTAQQTAIALPSLSSRTAGCEARRQSVVVEGVHLSLRCARGCAAGAVTGQQQREDRGTAQRQCAPLGLGSTAAVLRHRHQPLPLPRSVVALTMQATSCSVPAFSTHFSQPPDCASLPAAWWCA